MIAYPARGHEVRARIVAGAAPYHRQAGRPAPFARLLTGPAAVPGRGGQRKRGQRSHPAVLAPSTLKRTRVARRRRRPQPRRSQAPAPCAQGSGACARTKKCRPPTKNPCAQGCRAGLPTGLAGVPTAKPTRTPAGLRNATLATPIASPDPLRARVFGSRPNRNGRTSNQSGRRSDRHGRSPALSGLRARPGPLRASPGALRASFSTSHIVLEIVPGTFRGALIIAGGRLQGEDASGGRLGTSK